MPEPEPHHAPRRAYNDESRLLAEPGDYRIRVLAARDVGSPGGHDRVWRMMAQVVWSRTVPLPPGQHHDIWPQRACFAVFRDDRSGFILYARDMEDMRCSGPWSSEQVKDAVHSAALRFGGSGPLDDLLAAHWHCIVAGDGDLERSYPDTYTHDLHGQPPRRIRCQVREALERFRRIHGLTSTRQLAKRLGFTSDSTLREYLATDDADDTKWDQLDDLAERLGLEWSLKHRPVPPTGTPPDRSMIVHIDGAQQ